MPSIPNQVHALDEENAKSTATSATEERSEVQLRRAELHVSLSLVCD